MIGRLVQRLRKRVRSDHDERGQSILIDVLLAAALLGLLTVPALYLITTSTRDTFGTQFQTTASSIARGVLQQYQTISTTTTSVFPPKDGTTALSNSWTVFHTFDTKSASGTATRGMRDVGKRRYLVYVKGGWCAEKYTSSQKVGSYLSDQRKKNIDDADAVYFVGVKVYWHTSSVTKGASNSTSSKVIVSYVAVYGNYTKTTGPTTEGTSTSTTGAATTTTKSPINDCPLLTTKTVT